MYMCVYVSVCVECMYAPFIYVGLQEFQLHTHMPMIECLCDVPP